MLQSLDLSWCELGRDNGKILGRALANNRSLTYFNLSYNRYDLVGCCSGLDNFSIILIPINHHPFSFLFLQYRDWWRLHC